MLIFISHLFIGGKIKYTIKNKVISWQEDTTAVLISNKNFVCAFIFLFARIDEF